MRIGLCQINPTVGDLVGNARRIVEASHKAKSLNAEFAIFPELTICGYPPKDLLERSGFVSDMKRQLLILAAEIPDGFPVLVGFVDQIDPLEAGSRPKLFNAAALIRNGRVEQVAYKRLLPSYDVFDEDRYFEKGDIPSIINVNGTRFGITICEDAWNEVESPFRYSYSENPVQECVANGADVIVNIAASPFTLLKNRNRSKMLSQIAQRHQLPLVFVNQVGGNDSLIFDGGSAVFGPKGDILTRAKTFEEDILVSECGEVGSIADSFVNDEATILAALTLGTRDYMIKCGFRSALLGLSGGIDSAVVACIAARAVGPSNVIAVAMPTRYSSEGSVKDAEELSDALGIRYCQVPIDSIFQSYLDVLEPELSRLGPAPPEDVTFENIQSRIRGATLMAISNRVGYLLLNTGNKSEIATGYCTLYGDAVGGLAVISDLTKNLVYRMAEEINRQSEKPLIPERILTKPPSAELRFHQTDQDSLPPYDELDAIVRHFVEEGKSIAEIISAGYNSELVHRTASLIYQSEYKRRQMPPGLIVTSKAFGSGRRYPIAHRYRG